MIASSRLHAALVVLEKEYDPVKLPLSRFLNQWFKKNKQMGSRDRKILSSLLYEYFRCYHLLADLEHETRMLAARFLLNHSDLLLLPELKPDWLPFLPLPFDQKVQKLAEWFPEFTKKPVFPFKGLSGQIDSSLFEATFLSQPDLFIRIRKGFEKAVLNELKANEISYQLIGTSCVAMENQTKLDFLETHFAGDFEIQDLSSQQTASFFEPLPASVWWDACAGSGGKSLLLADLEPSVRIYASDYRSSSLENYRERMDQAGIRVGRVFTTDLSAGLNLPQDQEFDGIILDSPCSGSGTWARTPEMLAAFESEKLQAFSELQLRIAEQVIPFLKPGGALIYITCSVFAVENEDIVSALLKKHPELVCSKQNYLTGYTEKADTMFAARLIKSEMR